MRSRKAWLFATTGIRHIRFAPSLTVRAWGVA